MSDEPTERDVEALMLTAEVVAHLWREHANCTWVSTGVNVQWSCGILHPGPIHMQPTTRDRHLAALVMTQVEADLTVRIARARAEAWDEAVQALAWAQGNGPDPLRYVAEHNPHRRIERGSSA